MGEFYLLILSAGNLYIVKITRNTLTKWLPMYSFDTPGFERL